MFSNVKKMAISVKTMCLLALLLVLLSRSEVEKTFIADSFPNGSEASREAQLTQIIYENELNA